MAMADAQHMHAAKMARGEERISGQILEARQSDWKDEFVFLIRVNAADVSARMGGHIDDPAAI